MKHTTKTIFILLSVFFLWSCNNSKSFDFKDNYLTVKRTIFKINDDEFKVELQIKSPKQLNGYVIIEDKFSSSIISVDSTKWNYIPYYSSDKEIRFVFSEPSKTQGQATTIPNLNSFEVNYIVRMKDKKSLKVDGRILYLVNNQPVPELLTSCEY